MIVPVTDPPPTTEAGLSVRFCKVAAGETGCTVKIAGGELPPPGGGLVTTTWKVPAVLTSALLSEIVVWFAAANVAAWTTPLNVTDEVVRNPVPLIATVRGPDPALVDDGERLLMLGTGFDGVEGCTTKVNGCDVAPVWSGFVTAS